MNIFIGFLLVIIGLVIITTLVFMRQPSFGSKVTGERLERAKSSTNFKEGKFHNQTETPVMKEGISYFTLFRKQFFEDKKNREPHYTLPTVKRKFGDVENGQTSITWFGHSSILMQMNGKNILVDPVFSERTSPVQYFGTKNFTGTNIYSVNDLPKIDAVVISHDHYDHLDYNTIIALKSSVAQFYTPLGVGAHLEKWGVAKEKITELDWWESAPIDSSIQLIAAPARHFSGRGFIRNATLWASYIVKTDSSSIYLGADSGYDKHFKEIGDQYGPFDLVMLETGQYNEYWPNIHMMPEEAVQASIDLKGKIMLPIHWGKFSLAWHDWNDPVKRVIKKSEELNVKVITPMIGEEIVLNKTLPDSKWWNR